MSVVLLDLILLAVVVAGIAWFASRNAAISSIRSALEGGATVVDVRSRGEFREGHFPGALNLPIDQISGRLDEIGDRSVHVILYCHSGMRSGSAVHILRKAGFTKVVNAGTLGRIRKAAEDRS
jgi:phage shock protein E